MSRLDEVAFADPIAAARVADRFAALETSKFLRLVIDELFADRDKTECGLRAAPLETAVNV